MNCKMLVSVCCIYYTGCYSGIRIYFKKYIDLVLIFIWNLVEDLQKFGELS